MKAAVRTTAGDDDVVVTLLFAFVVKNDNEVLTAIVSVCGAVVFCTAAAPTLSAVSEKRSSKDNFDNNNDGCDPISHTPATLPLQAIKLS